MKLSQFTLIFITAAILLLCSRLYIVSAVYTPSSKHISDIPIHSPTSAEDQLEAFRNTSGITVSGLSSGAFFTVQLSIAYSRLISGFGTLAGGVYNAGQGNVAMAVSVMENPGLVNLPLIYGQMVTLASTGMIDPLDAVSHQQAFIFTGSQDSTVHPGHALLLKEMYLHLGVPSDAIQLVHTIPSQHAFVTDNPSHNACDYKGEPYINYCGYSTLKHLLGHVYPQVAPPSALVNSTRLHAIDQYLFIPPAYSPWSTQLGIHRRGYVYVPPQCEHAFIHDELFNIMRYSEERVKETEVDRLAQSKFDHLRRSIWDTSILHTYLTNHNSTSSDVHDGDMDRLIGSRSPSELFYTPTPPTFQHGNYTNQCRIHLAFHGCKQTQDHMGQEYIFQTGYLNYADNNDMVVIFPQASKTMLNPNGCFDWWGYSGLNYATKYGAQPMTYMHLATSLKSIIT